MTLKLTLKTLDRIGLNEMREFRSGYKQMEFTFNSCYGCRRTDWLRNEICVKKRTCTSGFILFVFTIQ